MSEANHGKGWTPDISVMISTQPYVKRTELMPIPIEAWEKAVRESLLAHGIDPDDVEQREQAKKFYHDSGIAEVVEYDTGFPEFDNLCLRMSPREEDHFPRVPSMLDIPTGPPEVLRTVVTDNGPVAIRIQYHSVDSIAERLRK